MQAELILTGTRPPLAAFQQCVQREARARLASLDEDSWARRLEQNYLLALTHGGAWSGLEDATTWTLSYRGHYRRLRFAAETVQWKARAHGLTVVEVHRWPEEGDDQDRAEDALIGLVDFD